MKKCEVSKATLGRVPYYINYIENTDENITYISATKIAKDLQMGEVQVRKDLSALCKNGRPKIGYEKEDLLSSLKKIQEYDSGNAIIVGAGKIGKALLNHSEFSLYGTKIKAAFDISSNNILFSPSDGEIYHISKLEEYCAENEIQIGIISVPKEVAQKTLNKLYSLGIKAFWCFTPIKLDVPSDAVIQYENLALSLAYLKFLIK